MKVKPEEFEKLLTQEGMREAEEWIAYLTSAYTRADYREWHESLLHKMRQTKGQPLSNSVYLHEIVEQQHILDRGKNPKNVQPDYVGLLCHGKAVEAQHRYLQGVARATGFRGISVFNILRFSPLIDSQWLLGNYYLAYTNAVYPAAHYKPGRVAFGLPRDYPAAIEFFQRLLEKEPQWAGSYSTLPIEDRIRHVETQEIVRPNSLLDY